MDAETPKGKVEEEKAEEAQLVTKTFDCSVCLEKFNQPSMYFLKNCSHALCTEDMSIYVYFKFRERVFPILCPEGCPHEVSFTDIKALLKRKENLKSSTTTPSSSHSRSSQTFLGAPPPTAAWPSSTSPTRPAPSTSGAKNARTDTV